MNMREIKKVEMNQIPNTDNKMPDKTEPQFCGEDSNQKIIKDLSNQTEILGRSQISKADNLKSDVAFGIANQDAISSADKFFDIAYAQLVKENDPKAYEKASTMASIYAREFAD